MYVKFGCGEGGMRRGGKKTRGQTSGEMQWGENGSSIFVPSHFFVWGASGGRVEGSGRREGLP